MLFPRPLTFELLNKSSRRVAVKGPGGLEWFELFGSSDFSLFRTLSREPLLALRRQPRCLHYEYNLERRTQGGGRVRLCSITRERHLNPFRLPATTVQLFAPSFGGPITCQGQWLENFVLIQDGVQACTVRWQRPLWSTSFCYDVVIAPQRDVLLFLGLACAIDCIDQTIERKPAREDRGTEQCLETLSSMDQTSQIVLPRRECANGCTHRRRMFAVLSHAFVLARIWRAGPF